MKVKFRFKNLIISVRSLCIALTFRKKEFEDLILIDSTACFLVGR